MACLATSPLPYRWPLSPEGGEASWEPEHRMFLPLRKDGVEKGVLKWEGLLLLFPIKGEWDHKREMERNGRSNRGLEGARGGSLSCWVRAGGPRSRAQKSQTLLGWEGEIEQARSRVLGLVRLVTSGESISSLDRHSPTLVHGPPRVTGFLVYKPGLTPQPQGVWSSWDWSSSQVTQQVHRPHFHFPALGSSCLPPPSDS